MKEFKGKEQRPAIRWMMMLLVALMLATAIGGVLYTRPMVAKAAASVCGTTPLLLGTNWMGGKGVDVCKNGANYNGKWQCVELINRLYGPLSNGGKGWITGNWPGNAYQMYDKAPSPLTKDPNGSITSINPGDVIVQSGGAYGGYGHVSIVDSVSGTGDSLKIKTVNQNLSQTTAWATFIWHKQAKTIDAWKSFTMVGIVHAPSSASTGNPSPTVPIAKPHYHDDIAWYDGATLYSFLAPSLGTSSSVTGYGKPQWAGVGDFNHDGIDDVFWYDGSTGTIYLIPGPSFTSAQTIRGPGVGAPKWAAVGDFSGDGYRDALVWYDTNNVLFTFEGKNLATTSSITGYTPPIWAGVGDFNHDGKDDLYWYQDTTIYTIPSNGPSFIGAITIRGPGVGIPKWAAAGDFSGDGYRDALVWYDTNNVLFTFEGKDLATTSSITGYTPPIWAGVGDYNHDGKDDLYWYQDTIIYTIPSNGPSFIGAITIRGPGVGVPKWADTGDFVK